MKLLSGVDPLPTGIRHAAAITTAAYPDGRRTYRGNRALILSLGSRIENPEMRYLVMGLHRCGDEFGAFLRGMSL